ncbi:peptide deformylase [Oerskovia turbata]|uniref:Peptide deformylase n=1 Tax=Oerskovia turbata TaxID=1713 RepID=A0A4Q1KQR2_9CELL|nr:peptide deformylase [Oerskovia turbata]RXR27415.1 peptide deformylase [Oerskovia turbata]RXR32357.1 peptide deformylase [Oerskovia turbata]TGJ95042.1 peptide deformylase [Actinotalea fermentans ATCC 43279 = JCM 9966 = DSM 3133]
MTARPADAGAGAGFGGPVDDSLRDQVADHLARYDDGVLPIVQAGHPVLRRPAAPYTGQLGDLFPRLVEAMRTTMHAAPGVGLAAPQVGLGLAVAVLQDAGVTDPEDADLRERHPVPFRVLVNPSYAPVGDEQRAFFEGCLSVSGWQAVVARHRSVRLTGQDEHGAPLDEVLTGWPARIVQHETDHLRGELYLDRAELRSLASNDNMMRFWGGTPDPVEASEALGFRLP